MQIPDVGSGGQIQVLLLAKPAFYQLSYCLVQGEDVFSLSKRPRVCRLSTPESQALCLSVVGRSELGSRYCNDIDKS